MKEKAWTEVVRQVGIEGDGAYLTVGPDADGLDCVRLFAEGQANKDYFGPLDLTISPALAMVLAAALIACATELSKEEA